MSANFGSMRQLSFIATPGNFWIRLHDPAWKLGPERGFAGFYEVDRNSANLVRALRRDRDIVSFQVPDSAQILPQLRTARNLRLGIVGEPQLETRIELDGSTEAFDRLRECVAAGMQRDPQARTRAPESDPAERDLRPPAPSEARTPLATATGFYITRTGHLLTAHHVVRGCTSLVAQVPGELPVTAVPVAQSQSDDLALLKTPSRRRNVAPFRNEPARLGKTVIAYGFPLQGLLPSSGNLTAGNVAALAGPGDDHRFLQFSAPVQPGNSGGPLLDLRGSVAGIVVAKLDALKMAQATRDIPQNVNFAVKASVILSFLEANGIVIEHPAITADLGVAEVAAHARTFTARIECYAR